MLSTAYYYIQDSVFLPLPHFVPALNRRQCKTCSPAATRYMVWSNWPTGHKSCMTTGKPNKQIQTVYYRLLLYKHPPSAEWYGISHHSGNGFLNNYHQPSTSSAEPFGALRTCKKRPGSVIIFCTLFQLRSFTRPFLSTCVARAELRKRSEKKHRKGLNGCRLGKWP